MQLQFNWRSIPPGPVTLATGGYLLAETTFAVRPFAISRTPVTNAQFAAFIADGGYGERRWWCDAGWAQRRRGGWVEPRHWYTPDWRAPQRPVVGVSWYEAAAFCRWLSAQLDAPITLPTEQQWQRAAQGDDGRPFPWGSAEPTAVLCNWNRTVDETTAVDCYPAGRSPFGVLDMSGNVWEWCRTGWHSGGADAPPDEPRLLRGGSWSSDSPYSLQVNHRSAKDPNVRLPPQERQHVTVGFRCVREGM